MGSVRTTLIIYTLLVIALAAPGYMMDMPALWAASVAVVGCALVLAAVHYTPLGPRLVRVVDRLSARGPARPAQ